MRSVISAKVSALGIPKMRLSVFWSKDQDRAEFMQFRLTSELEYKFNYRALLTEFPLILGQRADFRLNRRATGIAFDFFASTGKLYGSCLRKTVSAAMLLAKKLCQLRQSFSNAF
jgi:hypothetical protein